MSTIRVNGVDMNVDEFEGVSQEEHTARFQRFHRKQQDNFYEHGAGVTPEALARSGGTQYGNSCHHGAPPRHRKHRGERIDTVRIK